MLKHPLEALRFCPKCGSPHFAVRDEKSKKCESCNFVYYLNASSATVALIFNTQSQLLVATRAHEPAKGTLDLPGGFVDLSETAEESIRREIKEETNLEVTSLQYLFSVPNIYNYSNFEYYTLDMVFRCVVDDFSQLKAADDVASLKFINISDLNENDFGLKSIKQIIHRIKIGLKAESK